ncbi:0a1e964b-f8ff-46b3-96fe-f2fcfced3931 [Thermothielavioides terrestris]|uniref:0a1e964b-f8ff-46b3-96fe-f2fcfced3931 n=1 Tax=Thermothielavioides terrestris TaxID=2587410 RepID=A0A3S4B575_9PEZI|nr:0a1e964b-f8ff-46b3-96fe-f2fcfced3931 [Thermothielavioides terrestris]
MTIHSRWSVPIPRCSLQQWIFGSACGPVSDHKAFIDPDNPDTNFLTMANYRLLAKRVALGLRKAGLKRGDRVLIFSGNSLIFPCIFLGVLMAGGIVSGANPAFVPRELAYQLKDSEASFLFVAAPSITTAFAAAAEAGLPRDRIFVLGNDTLPAPRLALFAQPAPGVQGRIDGARHWTELLAGNRLEAVAWSWEEPANPEETTCCLNYSSGTTGVPKGVEISHHSYVANGVGVVHINRLRPDFAEKIQNDRGLAFLPFYHAYGQTYFIANLPHLGVPVYVMPAFDFLKMLAHIQRFRITTLPVVPPIVVRLAKDPNTKDYDLSSLESIGSGAAPLTREVCEEVERRFPGRDMYVRQGWGMTEVTCTAMSWDPTRVGPSAGVGELLPNCSARLMSLDGQTPVTKAGERGELWVTGPTLMRRYWRKPEATSGAIVVDADGTRWLKTGDVAFVDRYEPGAIFHVVDRVKELIKVKGNQVAPAELEGLLLESPDVADAAVIGVTIRGEELPRAYVVRKPGSKASENDIARWLRDKVAAYKHLRGGVVFVDQIPKNPSGKILRKVLRERAQNEVSDGARRLKI